METVAYIITAFDDAQRNIFGITFIIFRLTCHRIWFHLVPTQSELYCNYNTKFGSIPRDSEIDFCARGSGLRRINWRKTGKTTLRPMAVWETGASRHQGGPIKETNLKLPMYQITIVLMGLRGFLNWAPIAPRDASQSDNGWEFSRLAYGREDNPLVWFTWFMTTG